ncbi:methionine ABC transporter ATP-binding protein [Mycobacterium sp. CBMA271]|uniref:methionine ABC transporter ATP-binding protein n=1 Tax=unclassified Mycobacteroides TaxID=2618759 RepID=UPI0013257AE8|nr:MULTISPECIES: methionine ABC transporter ATP-binding protein [unclassified Mycobacteroides]MUM18403.1 methionine ABC transporter ATP-binding protein [Mycobacteroides sp. CBMA 326]MUM23673.1 methionine ABC transporter ATP-binding protein [Mycobacteroides sp. CBMA 271]
MTEPLIQFERVTKTFRLGKKTITAVDEVSLDIAAGEVFAMIGYSGAGKSTLVRLINGLERPTSGRIVVDGAEVNALGESELRRLRTDVGMIFQQFNLFGSRTVAGNIAYPLRVAGWPAAKRNARVAELLDFVGLADKATSYPDQLSGGQKQRVGIARALATSPSILLADEATSALDPDTTADVLQLLRAVNDEFGVTIVVITHEMDVVRTVADRVAVLAEGRVVEVGSVFDVFSAPQSEAGKRFVGTVLQNVPGTADIARIIQQHKGSIVSVEIGAGVQIGPALAHATELGVRFEVVYGGIATLQSRAFGNLTLALDGPDGHVTQIVSDLSAVTTVHRVAR